MKPIFNLPCCPRQKTEADFIDVFVTKKKKKRYIHTHTHTHIQWINIIKLVVFFFNETTVSEQNF